VINHIIARVVIVAMSFGAAAVPGVATAAIPAVTSAAASPSHVPAPAQADSHSGPDNTQWG
jgi:hypothetical protein